MAGPPALDQGFTAYGSKLVTTAAPYDPATKSGDDQDDARYLLRPGFDFLRPWLAVPNGVAFQWPFGLEGFSIVDDPTLGIHHPIGGQQVDVDVIHWGEEHITMSGNFLGSSSPALIQALRAVVKAKVDDQGKILYIPEVFPHAQRVQVFHAEFDRDATANKRDATYSIEFVILGAVARTNTPQYTVEPGPVSASPAGNPARTFAVTSKTNTLRKIAAAKLGSSTKWTQLFTLNEIYFTNSGIPKSSAPDYRLPIGAQVYY